jgi:hypothetical protein
MDGAPIRTRAGEQCLERERLLSDWTECGCRLAKLFEEYPATPESTAGVPRDARDHEDQADFVNSGRLAAVDQAATTTDHLIPGDRADTATWRMEERPSVCLMIFCSIGSN